MTATCRPRPLSSNVRGIFYLFEGSSIPDEEEFDAEPDIEYASEPVEFPPMSLPEGSEEPASARQLVSVFRKAFARSRGDHQFFRCETSAQRSPPIDLHGCELTRSHVTERYGSVCHLDVYGGPRASSFVPATLGDAIVSAPFRDACLRTTLITGWHFTEWPIAVSQTDHRPPALWHLEATGRNCQIPDEVVGGPNQCGHCGWGPVVCPACGDQTWRCPQCERETIVPTALHEGPADVRIAFPSRRPNNYLQIDLARWQGEDFVNCRGVTVVTRRVIDWMKALPAGPWVAYPLQAELAGLPPEMVSRLLEVAGSQRRHVERLLRPK